jgi:hypothetical protein
LEDEHPATYRRGVLVSAPPDAATVAYFWQWSDGSRAAARSFTDPQAGPVGLPGLVVASEPAARGRVVVLQFRADGRWHTEDVARTDERGRARVDLNPFCSDGDWCEGTLSYRLTVDGQSAPLRVTFGG